jgi:hypothetical protein
LLQLLGLSFGGRIGFHGLFLCVFGGFGSRFRSGFGYRGLAVGVLGSVRCLTRRDRFVLAALFARLVTTSSPAAAAAAPAAFATVGFGVLIGAVARAAACRRRRGAARRAATERVEELHVEHG